MKDTKNSKILTVCIAIGALLMGIGIGFVGHDLNIFGGKDLTTKNKNIATTPANVPSDAMVVVAQNIYNLYRLATSGTYTIATKYYTDANKALREIREAYPETAKNTKIATVISAKCGGPCSGTFNSNKKINSNVHRSNRNIKYTGSTTYDGSQWTNRPVTLTISAPNNIGLKPIAYSFDDGKTWQDSDSKTFYKSQTVVAKVKFFEEFYSISKSFTLKIDRTPPTIKFKLSKINWTKDHKYYKEGTTVRATCTDEDAGVVQLDVYDLIKKKWVQESNFGSMRSSYTDVALSVSTDGHNPSRIQVECDDAAGNVRTFKSPGYIIFDVNK